jgi:hypothetical protein
MMELSQSDYAALRGWSAAYVTKLKRQGRLVLTPGGKVHVEATDRLIAATRDPARGGDRRVQESDAVDRGGEPPTSAGEARTGDAGAYKHAATRERIAKARLAELELAEKAGQLVRRAEVETAIFGLARQAMEALDALADRLAAQCAAEADVERVHALITAQTRKIQNELAKATTSTPVAEAA